MTRRRAEVRRGVARRLGRIVRGGLRLARELLTILHVLVVISLVELVIRWVPLPRLTQMLGFRLSLEPVRADVGRLLPRDLPLRARRQLRCSVWVADRWPLSKGPCLRRALVAGHLLRDLDPALRLGIAGRGDDLLAHAWLEIDDRPLEGIEEFGVFQRAATEAVE